MRPTAKKLFLCLILLTVALCFASCGHEHVYGEWSYAVLPTCTEAGVQSRMCLECEVTEERPAEPFGHDEVKHEAVDATCTEKGNEAYVTCSRCDHTTFKETEALGHDEIKHERKQSTCLEKGWAAYVTCSRCDYTTFKELPKSGHQQAVLAAKQPTCTETGLTVGSYCKVCNATIRAQTVVAAKGHSCKQGICTVCGVEDYSSPSQYASTVCYDLLLTHKNGKKMQTLYKKIAAAVHEFHYDYTTDLEKRADFYDWCYIPQRVTYSDLGLTESEAHIAMEAFVKDNPIYYWLAGFFFRDSYVENGVRYYYCAIPVRDLYAKGSVRKSYNGRLAASLKQYAELTSGENSIYLTTLKCYESMLKNVEYSYDVMDKSSALYPWSRNVLGMFCHKRGVCSSYAEAFSLLLNYHGIENRYISGEVKGGGHVWVAARMDDGKWYWFDPTWDDSPNTALGFKHKYFCVAETDFVDWKDCMYFNGGFQGERTFSDEHTPKHYVLTSTSYEKQLPLPEMSQTSFDDPSVLEIREAFTVGKNAYARISSDMVQIVRSSEKETLVIPGKVTYSGKEYTVGAIGLQMDNGLFDYTQPITSGFLKNVVVPNSVVQILDFGLCQANTKINIFFEGTSSQWKAISKYEAAYRSANIYYYSEIRPTTSGNYWHYVNGVATPW